ncbi:hypothetical protein V6N13_036492 [Hibiscus sabdariffa]
MLPSLTVGLFLPQPTKPGNPTAAVRFKNPFSSWHTDRATEAGGDHMVGSREGPGPGFHYRTLSCCALHQTLHAQEILVSTTVPYNAQQSRIPRSKLRLLSASPIMKEEKDEPIKTLL